MRNVADSPSLVARRIQEIRLGKKLSRQQLADRLSRAGDKPVTYLQVYRIETGAVELHADDAPVWAEALECSVASLYRDRAAS